MVLPLGGSTPGSANEFAQTWLRFAQDIARSSNLLPPGGACRDPVPLQAAFLAQASKHYWDQQVALWSSFSSGGSPSFISPAATDRRFQGRDWNEHPWYSALKQAYLLNARLLSEMVEAADLDEKSRCAVQFFAQQFIDSMSPANFALTNPEAVKLALESNGASMHAGLTNLREDLRRGRIAITDESAFEVGRNVATSEGVVVFECELMQLIQYAPLTDEVAARPLLIVPPCVNKFYILDLQPENSFVRHAREQGQTVFLISWRNPDDALKHVTWDDYLQQGVIQAIGIALSISRADKVNAVGWCVGGTMLSSALAVQRARGVDTVASMTLLTTLLDFENPGDLGAFVDEPSVRQRECTLGRGGVFNGKELAFVFQMLRANDLLWPYVIDNYLKGNAPAAFRSAVLERRLDQSARPDVCVALASPVSREQPARSRQADDVRARGGSRQDRCADLYSRHAIGPSRAMAFGVPQHATARGRAAFRAIRARGERPHCRRHQPARRQQAELLDRRRLPSRRRRLVRHGASQPGKLVDALAQLGARIRRRRGAGAPLARQRGVCPDRAGTGALRYGSLRLNAIERCALLQSTS
jgi:hypothetical protein